VQSYITNAYSTLFKVITLLLNCPFSSFLAFLSYNILTIQLLINVHSYMHLSLSIPYLVSGLVKTGHVFHCPLPRSLRSIDYMASLIIAGKTKIVKESYPLPFPLARPFRSKSSSANTALCQYISVLVLLSANTALC
jgi:hypothetical protein